MSVMDNEKTFEAEKDVFYERLIKTTLANVEKKFGGGYYASNKKEAVDIIAKLITRFNEELDEGVKQLGVGDSLSVHQVGAFDYLYELKESNEIEIINPFERLEDGRFSEFAGYPNEWLPADVYNKINRRIWEKARRALLSDVFITGANAVTYNGTIVSTDGAGNRIAAVTYGPYKVILVVGRNKLVKDVEAAKDRIKNVAAPMNHYRHYVKHRIQGERAEANYGIYKFGKLPCVINGRCSDCGAQLCSRRATVVLERDTGGLFKNRIHLIIVNEDLGC